MESTFSPVFQAEFRHLRFPRTQAELRRFAWGVLAVLACLTVLFAEADRALFGRAALDTMFSLMLVLNLGITLGSDALVILTISSRIARQVENGVWDDLHLANLESDTILDTYHEVALWRARRAMIVQRACRVLPLIALIAIVAFDTLWGEYYFLRQFARNAQIHGAGYIVLSFFMIPTVIYLLVHEPRWQTQTNASIGLLSALLSRNSTSVALTGFGLLMAQRFVQAIILGVSFIVLLWLGTTRSPVAVCAVMPPLAGAPIFILFFHLANQQLLQYFIRRVAPNPSPDPHLL